jgi:hypothetical protein
MKSTSTSTVTNRHTTLRAAAGIYGVQSVDDPAKAIAACSNR